MLPDPNRNRMPRSRHGQSRTSNFGARRRSLFPRVLPEKAQGWYL